MKIYSVFHLYDVDGGVGDAIACEDLVASFERETDAKKFAEKMSNPHVYASPYDDLCCDEYAVRETELVLHKDFCEHVMSIPDKGNCCGLYSKAKYEDARVYAHYPECKEENCPLKHPELLKGGKVNENIYEAS